MKMNWTSLTMVLAIGMCGAAAQAAILQLDFSDVGGAYAGTNAPANTGSSMWFVVNEVSGGGQGTLDSGTYTYDLARGPGNPAEATGFASFNPQRTVTTNNGDGAAVGAIFDTALTEDGLRSYADTSTTRGPIAFALSGLANGLYDVYLVAHYAGNVGTDLTVGMGTIGALPAAENNADYNSDWLGFGGGAPTGTGSAYEFPSSHVTLNASNVSSWQQDNNFVKQTISITDASPVFAAYVGILNETNDGFLLSNTTISAIQFVPVPEPASVALIGLGVLAMMRRRRLA